MVINTTTQTTLAMVALGLAHGAADAGAAVLVVRLAASLSTNAVVAIFAYQTLAFALQPIAGLIVDRYCLFRLSVVLSLLGAAAGIALHSIAPVVAILLAGLGSAFFHVSGGGIIARSSTRSIFWLGWFAAPGVVGLAGGGYFALSGASDGYILLLLAAIASLLYFLLPPATDEVIVTTKIDRPYTGKEGLVLLLLTAIAVRSIVWNLVDILHQGDRSMLIYLAIAAGCGKFAGGMLAEICGIRRWGALGLTAAAVCLALAGDRSELLLLGVALLQSVTPIALAAAIDLCPQFPATGAGLALGLAIALGGICSIIAPAAISSPMHLAAIALTASILLFFALKFAPKSAPKSDS
jgi:MFS transporter, FSR family, fosmidomycin resistance protein